MLYIAKNLPSTTLNSVRMIHSNEHVYELSEFHAYIYDVIIDNKEIHIDNLLEIIHKDDISIDSDGLQQDKDSVKELVSTAIQDLQDIGAIEQKK